MRTFLFWLSTVVLAACAPPAPVVTPNSHPASTTAPAPAYTVDISILESAPKPDLPAALRTGGRGHGGNHGGGDHDVETDHEMDHDMPDQGHSDGRPGHP